MKYSKATNYALHTMLFMIAGAGATDKLIGVQHLAEHQQVSPTYLSKILTKLTKAGLIESVSGAHGGYRVKRDWADISFLDVIHAIEGTASIFACDLNHGPSCVIQQEMVAAEAAMETYLQNKKIAALIKERNITF